MAIGGVHISLNVEPFARKFEKLRRDQIEPLVTKAVNGVAFEVQLAERADVLASGFLFSANTANFLASFKVLRANDSDSTPLAYVMPRAASLGKMSRSERILLDHQVPKTISFQGANDAPRLGGDGQLAIPVNIARGGQGKVQARQKPSALVKKGRRQRGAGKKRRGPFGTYPILKLKSSGKTGIWYRDPNQENRLRLAYVLQKQAPLKSGPLDFYEIARKVAVLEFPRKMKKGFSRVR